MARQIRVTEKRKDKVIILHGADEVGVHLAWRSGVSIVVHQFVSDNFVELILDGLQRRT
jgi:hypothetical protein